MTNDIYVKTHDCLDFDVALVKEDGTSYTLPTGAKLWFVVGDKISKEQTNTHFRIDEVELSIGRYKAEVGIIFSDGTCKTVAQMNLFVEDRVRDDS